MDLNTFWSLIDEAVALHPYDPNVYGGVPGDRANWLVNRLQQLSEEDLYTFDAIWDALTLQVDKNEALEEIASRINGGFSDDGWTDFKAWMIAQGRSNFEKIMADPFYIRDMGQKTLSAEGFGYVSSEALEKKTGEWGGKHNVRGEYDLKEDKYKTYEEVHKDLFGPKHQLIISLLNAIKEHKKVSDEKLIKIGKKFARILK